MNTFFTNRLNGIFILNTLLELPEPVTVSALTDIINRRYYHVTAPKNMVSTDTVKRFLNDFYQTTFETNYSCFKLLCFKKSKTKGFIPDPYLENITHATYVAAYLQPTPLMNIKTKPASSGRPSFVILTFPNALLSQSCTNQDLLNSARILYFSWHLLCPEAACFLLWPVPPHVRYPSDDTVSLPSPPRLLRLCPPRFS